jgi:hypothetical protein
MARMDDTEYDVAPRQLLPIHIRRGVVQACNFDNLSCLSGVRCVAVVGVLGIVWDYESVLGCWV